MEKPRFTTRPRNGKVSLWVNDYNIWDLEEKELTEGVKSAIIHAYFLGTVHMKALINEAEIGGEYSSEFVEERE